MKTNFDNQIKADTIKIGDLLSGDNRLSIPAYQRPYDWKKDEANDLLEDLKCAIEGNYSPFFGTIVVDTSDKECFQIIDGQQRITTFNLLLIALRTISNKNGTKEDVRLATKINNVLNYENKTSGRSTDAISRLIPSVSIQEVYIPIAKNEDWNGKDYPTISKSIKIKKVKNILDFFFEELSKYKHDEISILLETLYSGYVIILKIHDKSQALEIFEHANVRGMELNAADLLKSYFMTTIKDQKDVDLENYWLEIVSNTDNIIRMIKHFGWTMFDKKIVANRNQYYDRLKKFGEKFGEKTLLSGFDNFAQAYGLVESGEIEDLVKWAENNNLKEIAAEQKAYMIIRSLHGIRLFRIAQAYPLIASALVNYKKNPTNTSVNALVELVDIIEKYHFINSYICQRRGNEVENLYADYCNIFMSSKNELSKHVNELKNKLKNQLADFKEFKPKFIDMSYDTSAQVLKSIYYLFDRIENVDRKGREIESIYNPRLAIVKGDWEVEHILAKRPEVEHKIKDEEVIDSIGNLLVVPSGTNKEVGNKKVSDKVSIYRERIGRMTSVMDFCLKYEEGKFSKFESEDNITSREEDLSRIVYGKVFAISKEQSSVLDDE